MKTKKFYYIYKPENILAIAEPFFPDGALPILWNNKGLFGLIRQEKIQNLVDEITDYKKDYKSIGSITFHWSETEYVPANVARHLVGEQ